MTIVVLILERGQSLVMKILVSGTDTGSVLQSPRFLHGVGPNNLSFVETSHHAIGGV